MNSIGVLEPIVFEKDQIRRLKDGSVSVINLIKTVGGYTTKQNAWVVWDRLSERYPEVSTNCRHFKFPGRGQRETPVASKSVALQILGLLPGEAGNRYRKEAAELMLQWYENPAELAVKAIEKIDNAEDSRKVLEKSAEQYITKYHPLFNELKGRGADKWTYININTLNTQIILKQSPKDVVLQRGGENARSCLSSSEYIQFAMLQDVQQSAILKADPKDKKEAYEVVKEVATEFEKFLSKYA